MGVKVICFEGQKERLEEYDAKESYFKSVEYFKKLLEIIIKE